MERREGRPASGEGCQEAKAGPLVPKSKGEERGKCDERRAAVER